MDSVNALKIRYTAELGLGTKQKGALTNWKPSCLKRVDMFKHSVHDRMLHEFLLTNMTRYCSSLAHCSSSMAHSTGKRLKILGQLSTTIDAVNACVLLHIIHEQK
jgi:hypothetical protein